MQAGLHADEQPGMLILYHPLPMLVAAENENRLNAKVVIMPMVIPLAWRICSFMPIAAGIIRCSG